MCFKVVDLILHAFLFNAITSLACDIEFAEQTAQFAGIRLAQVGIDFFNQFRESAQLSLSNQ